MAIFHLTTGDISWKLAAVEECHEDFRMTTRLPCDIGGAWGAIRVAWDESYFPFLNEELFGIPESAKSQGR